MTEDTLPEQKRLLQAAADLEFSLDPTGEQPLVFATDANVTADASGLYITFGQYVPPPFLTAVDQRRLVELGYVPYPVVARIAVSEPVAHKLRLQLTEQLETYRTEHARYHSWLREVGGVSENARDASEQATPQDISEPTKASATEGTS